MSRCTRCYSRAPFERRCAWCGDDIDLCGECLARTFLCDTCFTNQRDLGKDEAKALASKRAQELFRERLHARICGYQREDRRQVVRMFRKAQLLIWRDPA